MADGFAATYIGPGFSMNGNMGWMNDTLAYSAGPGTPRVITTTSSLSASYTPTPRISSAVSHDEVVHGKGSLLGKMPGDAWQKFANVRLLLSYQFASPARRSTSWATNWPRAGNGAPSGNLTGIAWHRLQRGRATMLRACRTLPRTACAARPGLRSAGFSWIDCHDADQSILAFERRARDGSVAVVALNFTPVPRHGYRIGLPKAGVWHEAFNSDSAFYAGANVGNSGAIDTQPLPWRSVASPQKSRCPRSPRSSSCTRVDARECRRCLTGNSKSCLPLPKSHR